MTTTIRRLLRVTVGSYQEAVNLLATMTNTPECTPGTQQPIRIERPDKPPIAANFTYEGDGNWIETVDTEPV